MMRKSQKLDLPTGFERDVITREFQIEKGGVELFELIQLYQSAVEYYDSIGDSSSSAIYSQKMQFLFLKPHISKIFLPKKEEEKISLKRSNDQDQVPQENKKQLQFNQEENLEQIHKPKLSPKADRIEQPSETEDLYIKESKYIDTRNIFPAAAKVNIEGIQPEEKGLQASNEQSQVNL